jgi:hypothetical protein
VRCGMWASYRGRGAAGKLDVGARSSLPWRTALVPSPSNGVFDLCLRRRAFFPTSDTRYVVSLAL